MNAEPTVTTTTTATTETDVDHRFLRQALKWLRSAHEEGAIKRLLDDLSSYLEQHFASEESPDGFFNKVLSSAPHHAGVVDELRREHATLLVTVSDLARDLKDTPAAASEEVLAGVAELVQTLEIHEQREEGLMQSALERDFGR